MSLYTLTYEDFYDIASYGNENWKGSYTQKEVACNAYDYLSEFRASKTSIEFSGEVTETIKELVRLLQKDGSYQCRLWLYEIADGLDMIDMNYHDYLDTDEYLNL